MVLILTTTINTFEYIFTWSLTVSSVIFSRCFWDIFIYLHCLLCNSSILAHIINGSHFTFLLSYACQVPSSQFFSITTIIIITDFSHFTNFAFRYKFLKDIFLEVDLLVQNWVWWCTSAISALGNLSQYDCEFKVNLSYVVRWRATPYLNRRKKVVSSIFSEIVPLQWDFSRQGLPNYLEYIALQKKF
jgi:hypothetical protein